MDMKSTNLNCFFWLVGKAYKDMYSLSSFLNPTHAVIRQWGYGYAYWEDVLLSGIDVSVEDTFSKDVGVWLKLILMRPGAFFIMCFHRKYWFLCEILGPLWSWECLFAKFLELKVETFIARSADSSRRRKRYKQEGCCRFLHNRLSKLSFLFNWAGRGRKVKTAYTKACHIVYFHYVCHR